MRAYTKYICILLFGFLSCNISPRMNFEVINRTQDQISNIKIKASGSSNIETIEFDENDMIRFELSMVDIPKTDGAYEIEFLRNGQIEKKKFGYYTNGYPINEKFIIEIYDLEIYIKEE